MTYSGRRVLVTGAGGFIGSHLVEHLVREGAEVRAMVHYNSLGSWGWLDDSPCKGDIEVVAGDVTDPDCARSAVRDRQIVFHLAALIAIPYSYQAPASYVRTNVEGTLNVLQACRDLDVSRVVHTSTSEVYGTARSVPIDEQHPLQGQSPYSATKIGADQLVESFHRSFDTPVVTVRPFNTFGPRQSARAVIPTIISQCLVGERVRLGNVEATRDMNYVENTVEGFGLAGLVDGADGQIVNLGSGREIAIGELARLIGELTDSRISIETDTRRLRPERSEVERLLADNRRAEQVLGWRPRIGLEEGLRRTIDWMRRNLNRYRPDVYGV